MCKNKFIVSRQDGTISVLVSNGYRFHETFRPSNIQHLLFPNVTFSNCFNFGSVQRKIVQFSKKINIVELWLINTFQHLYHEQQKSWAAPLPHSHPHPLPSPADNISLTLNKTNRGIQLLIDPEMTLLSPPAANSLHINVN